MASRTEIGVVYGAAIVQGLALVTFPAASSIFTSPDGFGFDSTRYGTMFVPQVVLAILASALAPKLARRLSLRRVLLAGFASNVVSMALLALSRVRVRLRHPRDAQRQLGHSLPHQRTRRLRARRSVCAGRVLGDGHARPRGDRNNISVRACALDLCRASDRAILDLSDRCARARPKQRHHRLWSRRLGMLGVPAAEHQLWRQRISRTLRRHGGGTHRVLSTLLQRRRIWNRTGTRSGGVGARPAFRRRPSLCRAPRSPCIVYYPA